MLQKIRASLAKWLVKALAVLICIPLLFLAANTYFGSAVDPVVAKVGDSDLPASEVRAAVQRHRRAGVPDPDGDLRRDVLQQMIDGEVALQFALGAGMRISSLEVVNTIRGLGSFEEGGVFSRDLYLRALAASGQSSPSAFEEQLRLDMTANQLRTAVVDSSFLLDDEVRRIVRLRRQTRDFAYAILPTAEAEAAIEIDEEEVERHYADRPVAYMRPEEVRLAYLELSLSALREQVPVDEEGLRAFYESRRAEYEIDEERAFTQLGVRTPEGATPLEIERARSRAEALLVRARDGTSLEDLAEEAEEENAVADAEDGQDDAAADEADGQDDAVADAEEGQDDAAANTPDRATVSDLADVRSPDEPRAQPLEIRLPHEPAEEEDLGEKVPGEEPVAPEPPELRPSQVDLLARGLVKRDALEPELAEAVFAMDPDSAGDAAQIEGVIEIGRIFYIVRLDEFKEGRVSTFDNSREDAERDYRAIEAERWFFEQAARLEELAYDEPDSLDGAAGELGLEVQTSDYIQRSGGAEGLVSEPEILDVAFSPELREEGTNSPLIELGNDRVAVIRIDDYRPQERRPLEEVRDEIEAELKRSRAREQVHERGQSILERLRLGEDRERIAEEEGIVWESREGTARGDTETPRAILRQVFRLSRPQSPERARYAVHELSGDYAVLALFAIHEVEDDLQLPEEDLDKAWDDLGQVHYRADWAVIMEHLRGKTEIRVLREDF